MSGDTCSTRTCCYPGHEAKFDERPTMLLLVRLVVWRPDLDVARAFFPALAWLLLGLISLSKVLYFLHPHFIRHPCHCSSGTLFTSLKMCPNRLKFNPNYTKMLRGKNIFSCPLCFNLGLVLISTSFLPFFNPPFIFCWCVGTVKCVGHPSVNFPVCLTPSL